MPDRTEPDLAELALSAWDYPLPAGQIAKTPPAVRSSARLMALPLAGGPPSHHTFLDLADLLSPGDLVVANDSRVMSARLFARRPTGGLVELVLLAATGPRDSGGRVLCEALARPARKLRSGDALALDQGGSVTVIREAIEGVVLLAFDEDPAAVMTAQGSPPLPPYLARKAQPADAHRYQTTYAGPLGSAAAPTAGLHFDDAVFARLAARDISFCTVTLHIGVGTFRNVRPDDLARGALHAESYEVPEATATRIRTTRETGGRVIAVGTTATRTLETATPPGERIPRPGSGQTDLFIRPPYAFRSIDGLVTNFHLPKSSLLMLVSALCGRDRLLAAYDEAVRTGYRFYSYGDAMLLL